MIKRLFVISLLFTVLFTGTYWYYGNASLCRYPIGYSIGEFDERFDITEAEARVAISDAATLWERASGQHLFYYDTDAPFTVNFVFDDRQELSDEERTARAELENLEARNIEVAEQYANLLRDYEALRASYLENSDVYEARLAEHNALVEQYNQSGGAPEEEFAALQAEQQALQRIATDLNNQTRTINQLTVEVNRIGEKGNQMIEQYNQAVAQYNTRFGQSREFTQGDYQNNSINIYTFASDLELRQVLAHELGHALALEHVDDSQAIMYYLMGTQPNELLLTEADVAEFDRVCGEGPGLRGSIQNFIYNYF